MDKIEMDYDEAKRVATITFGKGRVLRLSNVTESKAIDFLSKHAAEFQKRDGVLFTTGEFTTRDA